jgi:hypothetical protein
VSEIQINTRMVEEKFITLPWEDRKTTEVRKTDLGNNCTRYDVVAYEVIDSGIVDSPLDLVYRLSEQDVWDSQFGSAFIGLSVKQGWAIEQAGLGVRETRGGHHRTEKLLKSMKEMGLL